MCVGGGGHARPHPFSGQEHVVAVQQACIKAPSPRSLGIMPDVSAAAVTACAGKEGGCLSG